MDGRYTERQLCDEANGLIPGCRVVPQHRKDWTRWRLFPPPREGGTRGHPGLWYEDDRRLFVDLAWLHTQNCRRDAMSLGLWLLGYSQDQAQALLVGQLERTLERLTGVQSITDQSLDTAYRTLPTRLKNSRVLSDVLCERVLWNERERILGVEDVAGRVAEAGVSLPRLLHVTLPKDGKYPASDIPTGTLNELLRDAVIAPALVKLGMLAPDGPTWTLPGAIEAVRSVSPDHLVDALYGMVVRTGTSLNDGILPPHMSHFREKLGDLGDLLAAHCNSYRFLQASPRLFEWTSMEIATQILMDRQVCTAVNLGLLDAARYRWFRATTGAEKNDAALTQMFAYETAAEQKANDRARFDAYVERAREELQATLDNYGRGSPQAIAAQQQYQEVVRWKRFWWG